MAVWRAHHGHLDAHVAQSSDALCPVSFDRGLPFELEAELAKELNRRCEVVDDDADIVHPLKRHMPTLQRRPRFPYFVVDVTTAATSARAASIATRRTA